MKLSYGGSSATMESGITADRPVDLNAFLIVCFAWRRPVFDAGRFRYKVLRFDKRPRLKLVTS